MRADLRPPRSRGTLVWLLLTQALALASLAPWLAAAGLSIMDFDATRPAGGLAPWLFVGIAWTYPLLPVGCAVAAWIAYARGRYRRAAVLTSIPLLPALPLLVYLYWVANPT